MDGWMDGRIILIHCYTGMAKEYFDRICPKLVTDLKLSPASIQQWGCLLELLQLEMPPFTATPPIYPKYFMSFILPDPIPRTFFSKGIQQPDGMVVFYFLSFLRVITKKAIAAMNGCNAAIRALRKIERGNGKGGERSALEAAAGEERKRDDKDSQSEGTYSSSTASWKSFRKTLLLELKRNLPDIQVLLALVRKCFHAIPSKKDVDDGGIVLHEEGKKKIVGKQKKEVKKGEEEGVGNLKRIEEGVGKKEAEDRDVEENGVEDNSTPFATSSALLLERSMALLVDYQTLFPDSLLETNFNITKLFEVDIGILPCPVIFQLTTLFLITSSCRIPRADSNLTKVLMHEGSVERAVKGNKNDKSKKREERDRLKSSPVLSAVAKAAVSKFTVELAPVFGFVVALARADITRNVHTRVSTLLYYTLMESGLYYGCEKEVQLWVSLVKDKQSAEVLKKLLLGCHLYSSHYSRFAQDLARKAGLLNRTALCSPLLLVAFDLLLPSSSPSSSLPSSETSSFGSLGPNDGSYSAPVSLTAAVRLTSGELHYLARLLLSVSRSVFITLPRSSQHIFLSSVMRVGSEERAILSSTCNMEIDNSRSGLRGREKNVIRMVHYYIQHLVYYCYGEFSDSKETNANDERELENMKQNKKQNKKQKKKKARKEEGHEEYTASLGSLALSLRSSVYSEYDDQKVLRAIAVNRKGVERDDDDSNDDDIQGTKEGLRREHVNSSHVGNGNLSLSDDIVSRLQDSYSLYHYLGKEVVVKSGEGDEGEDRAVNLQKKQILALPDELSSFWEYSAFGSPLFLNLLMVALAEKYGKEEERMFWEREWELQRTLWSARNHNQRNGVEEEKEKEKEDINDMKRGGEEDDDDDSQVMVANVKDKLFSWIDQVSPIAFMLHLNYYFSSVLAGESSNSAQVKLLQCQLLENARKSALCLSSLHLFDCFNFAIFLLRNWIITSRENKALQQVALVQMPMLFMWMREALSIIYTSRSQEDDSLSSSHHLCKIAGAMGTSYTSPSENLLFQELWNLFCEVESLSKCYETCTTNPGECDMIDIVVTRGIFSVILQMQKLTTRTDQSQSSRFSQTSHFSVTQTPYENYSHFLYDILQRPTAASLDIFLPCIVDWMPVLWNCSQDVAFPVKVVTRMTQIAANEEIVNSDTSRRLGEALCLALQHITSVWYGSLSSGQDDSDPCSTTLSSNNVDRSASAEESRTDSGTETGENLVRTCSKIHQRLCCAISCPTHYAESRLKSMTRVTLLMMLHPSIALVRRTLATARPSLAHAMLSLVLRAQREHFATHPESSSLERTSPYFCALDSLFNAYMCLSMSIGNFLFSEAPDRNLCKGSSEKSLESQLETRLGSQQKQKVAERQIEEQWKELLGVITPSRAAAIPFMLQHSSRLCYWTGSFLLTSPLSTLRTENRVEKEEVGKLGKKRKRNDGVAIGKRKKQAGSMGTRGDKRKSNDDVVMEDVGCAGDVDDGSLKSLMMATLERAKLAAIWQPILVKAKMEEVGQEKRDTQHHHRSLQCQEENIWTEAEREALWEAAMEVACDVAENVIVVKNGLNTTASAPTYAKRSECMCLYHTVGAQQYMLFCCNSTQFKDDSTMMQSEGSTHESFFIRFSCLLKERYLPHLVDLLSSWETKFMNWSCRSNAIRRFTTLAREQADLYAMDCSYLSLFERLVRPSCMAAISAGDLLHSLSTKCAYSGTGDPDQRNTRLLPFSASENSTAIASASKKSGDIASFLKCCLASLLSVSAGSTAIISLDLYSQKTDLHQMQKKVLVVCLNSIARELYLLGVHSGQHQGIVYRKKSRSLLLESATYELILKACLRKHILDENVMMLLLRVVSLLIHVLNKEEDGGVRQRETMCKWARDLMFSHSSLSAVFDTDVPTKLVRFGTPAVPVLSLIFLLYREGPESMFTESVFIYLLSLYGATTSSTDRLLLRIILLFEHHGLCITQYGCEFGPSLSEAAEMKKTETAKSRGETAYNSENTNHAADAVATLFAKGCLDARVLYHSIRHYNVMDGMEGLEPGNCNQYSTPYSACKDDHYDPSFLLPCLEYSLIVSEELDCHQFILNHSLGFCIVATSSHSTDIREVAYRCLSTFILRLRSSYFPFQRQIMVLLDSFRNSLSHPAQRVPKVVTCFLAEATEIVMQPAHPMYNSVNSFFLQRPTMDVADIPMFYSTFNSDSANHKRERLWMLKLIMDCTTDHLDETACQVFTRRHVFPLLCTFFDSPILASDLSRRIVLTTLGHLAMNSTQCVQLVSGKNGILATLLHAASSATLSHRIRACALSVLRRIHSSLLNTLRLTALSCTDISTSSLFSSASGQSLLTILTYQEQLLSCITASLSASSPSLLLSQDMSSAKEFILSENFIFQCLRTIGDVLSGAQESCTVLQRQEGSVQDKDGNALSSRSKTMPGGAAPVGTAFSHALLLASSLFHSPSFQVTLQQFFTSLASQADRDQLSQVLTTCLSHVHDSHGSVYSMIPSNE